MSYEKEFMKEFEAWIVPGHDHEVPDRKQEGL